MTSPTALKAFLGCALLGCVFAAGASFARPPGPHKGNGPPSGSIEEHAEQLGVGSLLCGQRRRLIGGREHPKPAVE